MNSELRLIELARGNRLLATPALVRSAGLSAERWQRMQDRGLWVPVAPGFFRHAATPLTFEMQVVAGSAWLGQRGGLDGASALSWWGVDVPEPTRVEFLVPRSLRSIPNWMTIRTTVHWDPRELVRHRGIRTITATRAILSFAGSGATPAQIETAIDSAIRLRRTAMPRLTGRLRELGGSGLRGTVVLRELLLDSGGESNLERRFLRLMRRSGLPRPECQVRMSARGERVIRVDFHFPSGFVVEVSGRKGHTLSADQRKDARRRTAIQLGGAPVYEFTTADVIGDPDYVVRTIRTAISVAT